MKRIAIVAAMTVALFGCATNPQKPLLKQTASGNPEGRFPDVSVAEVKNHLVGSCARGGLTLHEASSNKVVCGAIMTGQTAAYAQLLIGNAYSSPPERRVQFTFFQSGPDVTIMGTQWVQTQLALGQIKRVELDTNNHKNELQEFLGKLGAK